MTNTPITPDRTLPVLVVTGPHVNGVISLTDGTRYNMNTPTVEVDPDHLEELTCHAEQMIQAGGVLLTHDDDNGQGVPFTHTPCTQCTPEG